ncbi:hypothetical protein MIND_00622300 [Mycena indigotica]|uniref:RNI-like protein n=1 Tax=Mycena indigotica TaxID=2126181 RepID=A0A8H6W6Z3_9AGAR|nr:uncharacterized protein MIND_00622300 [Mycena indigotica]KAF7303918.1 hypothetical protein MIND_00622300 [Mycena indigotica]
MSLHSPSLGPSSPSPSSSAVTIPIPGKSILKKPPPVQASFISRISRFLPVGDKTQPETAGKDGGKEGATDENARVLRRAHFILPELAVVYPISSVAPPSTPQLREEKRAIEDKERERRRRVLRANSVSTASSTDSASILTAGSGEDSEWWAMDKVESFYRECCEGCQESPDKGIAAALKNAPPTNPRTVDFSGVQLTFTSASILADVLSIEWGLRKAVFRECDLDEITLKPILHSLLIPRTLSYLSIASNRRLKGNAWKLLGAYLTKASDLQFLDVSQNPLDKKAVEYVVSALAEYTPTVVSSSAASMLSFDSFSIDGRDRDERDAASRSEARYSLGYGLDDSREKYRNVTGKRGLVSLKLDDCSLRAAALETLCRAVRTSSLRNISLRHNRISPTGAVALALMIRDYPDVLAAPASATASPTIAHSPLPSGTPTSSVNSSPMHSPILPHAPTPLPTGGKSVPPPRHPSQTITAAQTTYTPYVPRRRLQTAAPNPNISSAPPGRPVVATSVQGGVTARHVPDAMKDAQKERERDGPSAALLDKVRALDALPRVGALRTLDLRGNDLRTGITYIAQVLKRNRTLKVLNLSENKLDVTCLVSLAEALKYNSSLETLDLSRNPCSGPGLEGIQSLRTAFTLNTALKRLFLSSTGMSSPGAIALAEFLPESASLLHLDLTENSLGLAGVLALSKGLEANFVMRCLDLNIPPGDEECARLCRDILNACVRNTEEAERNAHRGMFGGSGSQTPIDGVNGHAHGVNGSTHTSSGRGLGKGVWGLIEDSELAKSIRLDEEKRLEGDPLVRAKSCVSQLEGMFAPPSASVAAPSAATHAALVKQARELTHELGSLIQATEDPTRMEELLDVNDALTTLIAHGPPPAVRPALTLQGLGIKWTSSVQIPLPEVTQLSEPDSSSHQGDGEHTPTTPRIDKGKARAMPEPEEPEKVLSPTLMLAEDSDEEGSVIHFSPVDQADASADAAAESPTNRSRSWVEEEGEVFRKGNVLLGPEEMEGEYAGDELRKELLEAMVERPPPRPLTLADSFGIEHPVPDQPQPEEQPPPVSPKPSPSPAADKLPPRPYVSRSRSASSSIMSMLSPTVSSFAPNSTDIPEGQASPRTPSSPAPPSPLPNGTRPYLARTRSSTLDNR